MREGDSRLGYSLDDVLLVPKRNPISSRLDTNIKTRVSRQYDLDIPIMSTNMSTITEIDMMRAMTKQGGIGVLHRFLPIMDGVEIITELKYGLGQVAASVGIGKDELQRAERYIDAGVDILLIDIAHGHSPAVLDQLQAIKRYNNFVDVIAGNIATAEAGYELMQAGADAVRVGIGGGSRCTTRQVTGHGVPNLTALRDVVKMRDIFYGETGTYIPVIIDGGLKHSGDIVKALYFGADVACLGGMLAGTNETPGELVTDGNGNTHKKFYGMASKEAQETHRDGLKPGTAAEGFSELVPHRGPVNTILENIVGGIRSGLTYSGARTIQELRKNGEHIYLTSGAMHESKL